MQVMLFCTVVGLGWYQGFVIFRLMRIDSDLVTGDCRVLTTDDAASNFDLEGSNPR